MRFVWVFLLLILSGCQRAMPLAVIPEFEVPEDLKGKTNLRPVGFDSAFIDNQSAPVYSHESAPYLSCAAPSFLIHPQAS